MPHGKRLSSDPQVEHFTSLFTPAECGIIRLYQERLAPSMVYDLSRRLVRDQIRTSDGATIHWLIEDPAIVALNRRIAAISHSAYEDGEALALLRYSPWAGISAALRLCERRDQSTASDGADLSQLRL